MIKIEKNGDDIIAAQGTAFPFVYLDQWALRKVSENADLSKRFQDILNHLEGTLAISYLHILEIAGVTIDRQSEAIAALIDGVYPNICFIDVQPEAVMEREDRAMKGDRIDTHLDSQLLKRFFRENRKAPLKPSFTKVIDSVKKDRDQMAKMAELFLVNVTLDLQKARDLVKSNQKYMARAKKVPKGPNLVWATRYIYNDILLSVIRNYQMKMSSNSWRDLFHTVVPLAYCNFLVLDGEWATYANQVKKRLQSVGNLAEMANVFSSLPAFLDELESVTQLSQ